MFLPILFAALPWVITTPTLKEEYHAQLAEAVMSVGVDVRINESRHCNPKFNRGIRNLGWYHGQMKMIMICQTVAHENNSWGEIYEWNDEDYDTLRHEAHHLVQDCMDNKLDQQLTNVYEEPIRFAVKVMGANGVKIVVDAYPDLNVKDRVIEIEAFSVARMNDPLEQIEDIKRYCM